MFHRIFYETYDYHKKLIFRAYCVAKLQAKVISSVIILLKQFYLIRTLLQLSLDYK